MADPVVELRNLCWSPAKGSFRFGPSDAEAQSGEFIVVVGPNGAGKSTLLKLIAGLLDPDRGEVLLSGKMPRSMGSRERGRRMAFLSQDPERPFGFGVEDYVGLGRYPINGAFRGPDEQDRDIIRREIRFWGLESLTDRSVSNLSGGEFQRVRLARSLCQEPELLLLDEPGNHLDLSSRMDILNRLKADAAGGRCVVAVLHDINDALLFADTVWLMSNGTIIGQGRPESVLDRQTLEDLYGLQLNEFRSESGMVMLGVLPSNPEP